MPKGVAIGHQRLSGTSSSITFNNISGEYRDLELVISLDRSHGSPNGVYLQVNSNSSAIYRYTALNENGVHEYSTNRTYWNVTSLPVSYPAHGTIQMLDYSQTDRFKPMFRDDGQNQYLNTIGAGQWDNTDAITSLTIYPSGYNFIAGDSFAIYGVL